MDTINENTDQLAYALKTLFGLDFLFPYQRLVISNILEAAQARGFKIHWPDDSGKLGKKADDAAAGISADANTDVDENLDADSDRGNSGRQIVILPTGAGKSLCFQLPAMLLSGPTLVIYPILSLMADQERRLREKGFAPVLLRGGQTANERSLVWENLHSGKSRFIIANPEVLLSPRVMEKLPDLGLIHLVIDEAHCVSEWGESFRPAYLRIGEIIKTIRGSGAGPLVTAFTATASEAVLEKISKYIFESDEGMAVQRVIGNPDRANIAYSCSGALLRDIAVRDLLAANERPAIVFCSSRPGVEKLARYLQNSFRDSDIRFYHAGLSKEEKTAVEKWFFPNPRGVLVSTCAYGMGVDKADIRTVIHRDCPPSVEAYLQESGRAGRDGKQSRAVLLWGPEDDRRSLNNKRFMDLINYAKNNNVCRRDGLLNLLNFEGVRDSPGTECCDVCKRKTDASSGAPHWPEFREEDAVIDFIQRNRRIYTVNEAAGLFGRAKNLKINEQEAGELISALLTLKKIRKSINFLWKDRLIV